MASHSICQIKKNHTDLQISTKSAYKQNIFFQTRNFLHFHLYIKTEQFATKGTALDKKSDLRSKSQIRVTKKIKSIGRKNVQ